MTPKRRLQLRVLEQVVQHDVGHFAALQLDDDADTVAIGFVANVRDAFDHLVAHQFRELLLEQRLVHLIRELGDDDLRAIGLADRLDVRPSRAS